MILREPCLPSGWYPRDKGKIAEFLDPFGPSARDRPAPADAAAVAPHAGWYYSGVPAAIAVSALAAAAPEAETVAVIGGHLPSGSPVLAAVEEGVKTPLGIMAVDRELRDIFEKLVLTRSDRYSDNTVEVLLPMVHYFFPGAKLLWLRFPAALASFEAGKLLAKASGETGRRLAVLASTDLTHYGANYGFSPKGRGKPALEWVKNVNDAGFISAVLDGDPAQVLKRAEEDRSSCSAGAVLGALGFTGGKSERRLLDYRTSADVDSAGEVPDSFVGYAAIG